MRFIDPLEEEADLLLSANDKIPQKRNWLSHEQLYLREHREVPVGLIKGGAHPGQYSRAYNPDIGKRPDPNNLFKMDPWGQLLYEFYGHSPGSRLEN